METLCEFKIREIREILDKIAERNPNVEKVLVETAAQRYDFIWIFSRNAVCS